MAIIKTVLFNDGEGIVHSDFNNVQKFIRAQALDLQRAMFRGTPLSADSVTIAYCYGAGGAPRASITTRRINHDNGWIGQQLVVQDPVGDEPNFLLYHLADAEAITLTGGTNTLAVGDASNPRYDILCYKLSTFDTDSQSRDFLSSPGGTPTTTSTNKQNAVKCEMQVVQGTPAASPVQPATPTGWVKLCAVSIPTAWNAVIDPANIFDYRLPVGITEEFVYAGEARSNNFYTGTWNITNGTNASLSSGSGAQDLYMRPDGPNPHRRLIGVVLHGGGAGYTNTTVEIRGYLDNVLYDATATLIHSTITSRFYGVFSTSLIPVWGNGTTAGRANSAITYAQPNSVYLAVVKASGGGTTTLHWAKFIWAGTAI